MQASEGTYARLEDQAKEILMAKGKDTGRALEPVVGHGGYCLRTLYYSNVSLTKCKWTDASRDDGSTAR